jgi:hypothetical protein
MILGGEARRGDVMNVVGHGDDLILTIDKI